MAKIGTAHVEIKPVISEDTLEAITARIADAVALGVQRGMASAQARPMFGTVNVFTPPSHPARSPEDAAVIENVIRQRTEHYKSRD